MVEPYFEPAATDILASVKFLLALPAGVRHPTRPARPTVRGVRVSR
ncbi:hypothetical protein [Micromonospora sp. NPDC048830]